MKVFWILLIVLAALLLLLFLLTYYIMRYACRRGKTLGTDLSKELEHSSFRRYKDGILQAQQWLAQQPQEEVFLTSYDGLRLRARYIPCENARATLLLFHGWRSHPEVDFGIAFSFYQSLGLNLLLPDERAQGGSEGRCITFGIRERHDVLRWVQWVNECFGAEQPLLVAYNAQFDLNFLYYLLRPLGLLSVLQKPRFLDALTVYRDRRDFPHKLCNAIEAYGLTGVENSHRAVDDARAAALLLEAMAAEKDDLLQYVDLFGVHPKYGMSGKKISSVTYCPQPYDRRVPLYELLHTM